MGQLIWTLGIIATALVWNHHEAKQHEPPAQNRIVVVGSTHTDSTRADSIRTVPR